ncbi:MAG: hypothetical protein ABDI19_08160 [Armatimonadota bacterium]
MTILLVAQTRTQVTPDQRAIMLQQAIQRLAITLLRGDDPFADLIRVCRHARRLPTTVASPFCARESQLNFCAGDGQVGDAALFGCPLLCPLYSTLN